MSALRRLLMTAVVALAAGCASVPGAAPPPKDTSAKILTAGLLGDQYVGLEPGGDDKDLAAGSVIAQTQSAVVLENLIGQFIAGKADSAATPGASGTSGTSGTIGTPGAAASGASK